MMSSSNRGHGDDKKQEKTYRKVQTTNLVANEDDNQSTLRDLIDVFYRIGLGMDQQEVIMITDHP